MSKPLRIGMIGYGFMGRAHSNAWSQASKFFELRRKPTLHTLAARNALLEMIDHIMRTHGLTAEQAYILASVAVDLRVGQVVDVPNYVVTAVLKKEVFVDQ